jgi:galactose mutarotase-like enzyme|tara:strand:+ start:195 stop:1253 length:1059 start_codon:yes stop_codon:yes gene_type:complete
VNKKSLERAALGCNIKFGLSHGELECLVLENEKLYLKILVDKGADVIELIYKPTKTNLIWISERGIPEKKFTSNDYANDFLFTDSYAGGWQTIFPNGGLPSDLNGMHFSQHDEVALKPWKFEVLEESANRASVCFEIFAEKLPFRITKTFTLEKDSPYILIEESIENLSSKEWLTMWGSHITFGPPFLSEKSKIILYGNPRVVPHSEEVDIGGRRLGTTSEFDWPIGLDSNNMEIDFSNIPKPGTKSELLYISNFEKPSFRIESSDLNLAIDFQWDETIFPYLWYWQEFGNSNEYPWFGKNFNIGLEPFSSFPTNGLAEAVKNHTAMRFDPKEIKTAISNFKVSELQITRKG